MILGSQSDIMNISFNRCCRFQLASRSIKCIRFKLTHIASAPSFVNQQGGKIILEEQNLIGKGVRMTLPQFYRQQNTSYVLIWSSKNGHPVKRLLPKKNYSQKHLGCCILKTNGDDYCYNTFQYISLRHFWRRLWFDK